MMSRPIAVLVLSLTGLVACSHPSTVVHLSAPAGGTWSVSDATGSRLCSLPCRVEIEKDESVVLRRDGSSKQFVVEQKSVGEGTWNGSIRLREEPSSGASAVRGFSTSLVNAGNTLIDERKDGRLGAGVALSGLGMVGMLLAGALPSTRHEELWLERATP